MATERFTIEGEVGAAVFPVWIERHARRLGLSGHVATVSPHLVELLVEGPEPLLDAMEMGCLLGPIDVWVDSIRREPLTNDPGADLPAPSH